MRAVAPPWPGAFAEIEGRRSVIAQGEPVELITGRKTGPAPGTVRRDGDVVSSSPTGDRWFRIDNC